MRQPHDFKEVRMMIEKFYWFKQNIFGIEFNNLDATELSRHIRIKYYEANKPVFVPGESDRNLYFILKGKVIIGIVKNDKDSDNIFSLT